MANSIDLDEVAHCEANSIDLDEVALIKIYAICKFSCPRLCYLNVVFLCCEKGSQSNRSISCFFASGLAKYKAK